MRLADLGRWLHPERSAAVRTIARLGFAAKGLLAIMIGALALRLALGNGGRITGPKGALQVFLHEPFGRGMLAIIALGLWAHALWKGLQAILDPEDKGTGFAAVMERTSYGLTALGYIVLGMAAARLVVGLPLGGGGEIEKLAATALSAHFGRWVVGLIGAVVIIAAAVQIRFAARAGFRHILRLEELPRPLRWAVVAIGSAGYGALALLSALVGYFLFRVALSFRPDQAGGWSQALGFLTAFHHGRWLLGVTAAGIVCYGLYFLIQVHYREF